MHRAHVYIYNCCVLTRLKNSFHKQPLLSHSDFPVAKMIIQLVISFFLIFYVYPIFLYLNKNIYVLNVSEAAQIIYSIHYQVGVIPGLFVPCL